MDLHCVDRRQRQVCIRGRRVAARARPEHRASCCHGGDGEKNNYLHPRWQRANAVSECESELDPVDIEHIYILDITTESLSDSFYLIINFMSFGRQYADILAFNLSDSKIRVLKRTSNQGTDFFDFVQQCLVAGCVV